jgi:hypothetical protein
MYKEATYKQKFSDLRIWIPFIINAIKKDLRNEHLKKDLFFVKKFLGSKNIHKIEEPELAQAYEKAIIEEEKGEELGEFVSSRWMLKNTEIYDYFESHLSKVHSDFTELSEIDPVTAQKLISESTNQFGALRTYLFSVLNSVVFTKECFEDMQRKAKEEQQQLEKEQSESSSSLTLEQLQSRFERDTAKITDKYEKKLSGMQKKYQTDVDGLRKQISLLQRKLHEAKV